MPKRILIGFICFFYAIPTLTAQIVPGSLGYYQDALRYSNTTFSGTARFQGLAGSASAIGGDMSSLSGNPAGLGYYRKSEINLTTSLGLSYTESNYFNNLKPESKFLVNIPNFGMTFSFLKKDDQEGKWRGLNIGLAFSRINSFQNEFTYQGVNNKNSLLASYVQNANGTPESALAAQENAITTVPALAYFTNLITPLVNDPQNRYFQYFNGKTVDQYETVNFKGGQNQWSFSLATNFSDRFYLGATLALQTLNYEKKREYSEYVVSNAAEILNNFKLTDEIKTTGTGVNLTIGMIYRVANVFRIGASFTTPSYYSIQEKRNTNLKADFNSFDPGNGIILGKEEKSTLPIKYNYQLITPLKATIGTAFFIGKYGFITADAEYIDYTKMELREKSATGLQNDNQTIKNLYAATFNYRFGIEIRVKQFRIRGGYAYYGNPYKPNTATPQKNKQDGTIQHITGGFGIRKETYYLDFTGKYSLNNTLYSPYTLSDNSQPSATIKNYLFTLVVSGGVFF